MQTKMIAIVVLAVLGLYFLFGHYPPFPLSHEDLGLTNHDIHRIIGVVLLVAAGYVWWTGRAKKTV